jgi:3-hydroxyacyl-[acyl-carrier-protein] dehydratase
MLLLDRLEDVVPGRSGRAWKAVSANEAHSRAGAVRGLPATLLVDALGQLAIAVLASSAPDAPAGAEPRVYYLAEIEELEFGPAAQPGDRVRLEANLRRTWGRVSRVDVRADVDGRSVARGRMALSRADGH